MEDVKRFFFSHYGPNNAVLTVAGDVTTEQIKVLAEKWFGNIDRRKIKKRSYEQESEQNEYRFLEVKRDVPADALQMAFQMCDRLAPEYYATDLLSDVLSNGKSSRLYKNLVQEQQIFSELDAYIMGSHDKGMFMFKGKLMPEKSIKEGEDAIWKQIDLLLNKGLKHKELLKVQNKVEANLIFNDTSVLSKAMNLSSFELLGDANMLNQETQKYKAVTEEYFIENAKKILRKSNCSSLHYHKK
jgi:predicted Zn-dependent peptidase